MENNSTSELTPIERTMLQLLSQGLTEREVSLRLNKSVYTVDKYLRNVFLKLKVHNTTAAVAEAMRRKVIK